MVSDDLPKTPSDYHRLHCKRNPPLSCFTKMKLLRFLDFSEILEIVHRCSPFCLPTKKASDDDIIKIVGRLPRGIQECRLTFEMDKKLPRAK